MRHSCLKLLVSQVSVFEQKYFKIAFFVSQFPNFINLRHYHAQRQISTTVASGTDKNLKGISPQPNPREIKTEVPLMS